MRTNRWTWAVMVGVLATGCSLPEVPSGEADDAPPAQAATVNKQVAGSVAQSTISALSATVSGTEGAASAGALAAVAQSSQSLLSSSGVGTTRSPLTLEGAVAPLAFGGPGCECTATECTFTNCSPLSGTSASGSYAYTVDGYYSWADGHVVCRDLKYSFSTSGGAGGLSSSNLDVTLNCDVTITSTSIDGFIRSAGSSSADLGGQNTQYAYSASWDVTTKFQSVTFGTNRTPTGGSMHVEGTTSTNYGGQAVKSEGKADVSFPL